MAKQIADSTECAAIVNQFKSDVTGTSYVRKTNSGTTTLNSTTDLHLAYNNVNYSATDVKSKGTQTLTITFTDTYDFDTQAWNNAMTDNALVTILNNYAAYAQSIGAIVPYDVIVTVKTTFQKSNGVLVLVMAITLLQDCMMASAAENQGTVIEKSRSVGILLSIRTLFIF